MFSSLTGIIATAVVLLHPVHETVSEIEWNPKTHCLEVALRLDVLDEQWISKQQTGDRNKGWQAKYLQSRLLFDAIEDSEKKGGLIAEPLRWIGRKEEGGYVWWFFEVVCENGKPPSEVSTRLLFDREPGYEHRIVLLGCAKSDGQDCALILNEAKPQAALPLQQDSEQR